MRFCLFIGAILSSVSISFADNTPNKKILFETTLFYNTAEKYEIYEQGDNGYLVFHERGHKKKQKIFTVEFVREYYQSRVLPFFEVVKNKKDNAISCSVKATASWRDQGEMEKRSFCLGSDQGNQISPLIRAISFELSQD